jgi:nucleoside-diphosphate-sugar epimerase
MKVLIAGIIRGIRFELAKYYLNIGAKVYGIGRSNPFGEKVKFVNLDLSVTENISDAVMELKIDELGSGSFVSVRLV